MLFLAFRWANSDFRTLQSLPFNIHKAFIKIQTGILINMVIRVHIRNPYKYDFLLFFSKHAVMTCFLFLAQSKQLKYLRHLKAIKPKNFDEVARRILKGGGGQVKIQFLL